MCATFQATRTGSPPGVLRVVVTFSLPASQMTSLKGRLGPAYRFVDPSIAVDADIVICPPCSTRTIEKLGKQYPGAAIIVVEPDEGSGSLDAPVARILAAGAAAYLTDPTSDDLVAAVRAVTAADR